MASSSAPSVRPARRQKGGVRHNTTDSTIGISIVGPAETEGPMQVPIDAVTLDGSHAEQAVSQEGPISPLLFDGHRLDTSNWEPGYLTPDYQVSWSPVSSPPCSPPPSSGGSTPDSAFSGHDIESNSLDLALLSFSDQDPSDFFSSQQERLARREQVLPALILQGSPSLLGLPTFAHEEDFDEKELALLHGGVVDQYSPSLEQLVSVLPPSSPLVRSASDPFPSRRKKGKNRAPTPLLLPLENPPLTRIPSTNPSARRSRRRASSGAPYPSPHSSPSSPSPRESSLTQSRSVSNSTSPSMDAFGRVMYHHASTSTPSLPISPRGPHAASHASNYSPELRPQSPSPSFAQRSLARANRRRSRSISPFDGARRSSSRSRSDAFSQVPNFLAQAGRNAGCNAGSSLPTPQSSSLPKGYRLRGATFEAQPVVYAGGTQRPSSMVRASSPFDDAMYSSSGDDDEMAPRANSRRDENDNRRRRAVSESSSSSSPSSDFSLSLPPQIPSPSAPPMGPGEKHVVHRNYYEGDGMAIDSRGCDDESDDGENEVNGKNDAGTNRRTSKGKEREQAEKERRRSSYPSQPHISYSVKNSYTPPPTSYGNASHLPSPAYTPSTLRDEVPRARISSPRSQSHSPSRQDRSRSLSRARYVPTSPAQRMPPTPASTSKSQAGPVRRSRRLSNSPTRQGVSTAKGKVEHILDAPPGPQMMPPPRQRSPARRASTASAPKSNHTSSSVDTAQDERGTKLSARSRSRDVDYTSYRPHQRQTAVDTDEEEDMDSGVDYDEDDEDYCERGSYRGGGRSRQRGSPTKRSFYPGGTSRPLPGSPLKGSILPPSSDQDSKPRTRDATVQTQSGTHLRRARASYPPQPTQRGSRTENGAYTSTASLLASSDTDAAATTAGIADAAVSLGGIIVSGVVGVVGSPGQTQYRSVGSKNIDNASEKRRRGEKRFQCRFENCQKLFTTNQNRQIHQWKHTGAKPYCCHCGYGSASRSDLRRHLNRKNVNPACRELPVDQEYLNALVAAEDDNC